MPWYRRLKVSGGTYFFTLVTEARVPLFADQSRRDLLRGAIEQAQRDRPFDVDAIVLLPDHLHLLMTLPEGDSDFSSRLSQLKSHFTREHLRSGGAEQPRSTARISKRRRGVWQRWFWEHLIRDDRDRTAHLEYILFNPVKHRHARCPHEWPWSSFGRYVDAGMMRLDWECCCHGARPPRIDPNWADLCEPK